MDSSLTLPSTDLIARAVSSAAGVPLYHLDISHTWNYAANSSVTPIRFSVMVTAHVPDIDAFVVATRLTNVSRFVTALSAAGLATGLRNVDAGDIVAHISYASPIVTVSKPMTVVNASLMLSEFNAACFYPSSLAAGLALSTGVNTSLIAIHVLPAVHTHPPAATLVVTVYTTNDGPGTPPTTDYATASGGPMDYDYFDARMPSALEVAAALSPEALAGAFAASSCLTPVVLLSVPPFIAYLSHRAPSGVCSQGTGEPSAEASITFDIPFTTYSANAHAYGRAIARGVAPRIGHHPSEVVITSAFAASWPVAGTSVTFRVALPTGVLDLILPKLAKLFTDSALPRLVSALSCAGLPLTTAFLGSRSPSPPPPLGTFKSVAQAQQLAFDIPFNIWAARNPAYNPAVQSAIADALGLNRADVWVTNARPSAHGTIVTIDIATVSSSSDIALDGAQVPHPVIAFAALFGSGNGFTTQAGEQATAVFVAALRKYGLQFPPSGVYYFEHPSAPARRLQQYAAQHPDAVMAATSPAAPCVTSVGALSSELSMTVDIGFTAWKNNSVVYTSAFARAVVPLLGTEFRTSDIVLTTVADAGRNRVALFFAVILDGPASDADLTRMGVALFSGNASVSAFVCAGLPITTVMQGNTLLAPPPPLAQFKAQVQGQQIAFDILFPTWLARTYAFSPAVESAIAEALGLNIADVWVTEVRSGISGGSVVSFDIVMPSSSSEVSLSDPTRELPTPLVRFAALFGAGNGFATEAGDLALPGLMALLQKYGLPANSA